MPGRFGPDKKTQVKKPILGGSRNRPLYPVGIRHENGENDGTTLISLDLVKANETVFGTKSLIKDFASSF